MGEDIGFRWSGHDWYIEEDLAWFIDGQSDILCCLNLLSGECSSVVKIPNEGFDKFMLNTRCIKVNNEIFCMPCYGDRIWIYDIVNAVFQYIKIENLRQVKLYMEYCWKHSNKIFAISRGLNQVIVIDIDTKEIDYYPIDVEEKNIFLSCCIKVETNIYCVSCNSNKVYQFDMKLKETLVHTLPDVKENLCLICFDGDKFWLSGFSKKIYIWYKNSVKVIRNFPKQFGNYNFFNNIKELVDYKSEKYDIQLFCRLEAVGKYIWAIPYTTNFVLYIDKDTFEIHVLSVMNEEETKESLSRSWKFKYFWQYLKEDKYIGIFSLKNNCIIEINTAELKGVPQNYVLDNNYIRLIWDGQILYESQSMHKKLFGRLVMLNDDRNRIVDGRQNEIGSRIYSL